jgi:hypothetical protein
VPLRGMRTLGVGLPRADEEAMLHTWNVMGHLVGIRPELMCRTMDEAGALFERLQARARAEPMTPDPRPALADALMRTMEALIPWSVAKPFPVLLTRWLCGRAASRDLGLDGRVGLVSKAVFLVAVLIVRGIDALLGLISPRLTLARLITRLVGRRFLAQLLMDQTRPLKLPQHLLGRVGRMMAAWS